MYCKKLWRDERYEEYAKIKGLNIFHLIQILLQLNLVINLSKNSLKTSWKRSNCKRFNWYGQNAIRITIGRNEQNTKVFEQLDEVLENLK